MSRPELKTEVERGSYRAQPELVATAMLKRRGMRAFLFGGDAVNPAGRSRPAPSGSRPQAA